MLNVLSFSSYLIVSTICRVLHLFIWRVLVYQVGMTPSIARIVTFVIIGLIISIVFRRSRRWL